MKWVEVRHRMDCVRSSQKDADTVGGGPGGAGVAAGRDDGWGCGVVVGVGLELVVLARYGAWGDAGRWW